MEQNIFDAIVIGGGPAGYVCCIKAAQLGLKVACIEEKEFLGGTCLNEGCIPSKTLLNSSYLYYQANKDFKKLGIEIKGIKANLTDMMQNKLNIVNELANGIRFLFKKNKIELINGIGKVTSCDNEIKEVSVNGKILKAKNIVIATGSVSAKFPGVEFDEENILSSKSALELKKIPKSMIVIGGGAIGLEMASVWNRLGAKITVIEYAEDIAAGMDCDISAYLFKSLQKQGIEFFISSKVEGITKNSKDLTVSFIQNEQKKEITVEKVLISIGRKPNTESLEIELEKNQRGFIKVNESFETSIKGIYAIGDAVPGPMLAHKGEEEGVAVAEILSGKKAHIGWVPSVIYTHPEAAGVGKTEQELKSLGVEYKVSKFSFSANSRAKANNDAEGFVKIIVDKFDTILGAHIIGGHASSMMPELVLAMEYGASAEDIARTCHSHPDLGEAIKEAALGAYFKPIHN